MSEEVSCGSCGHLGMAHRPEGNFWPCAVQECGCPDFAVPGSVMECDLSDNGNSP